MNKKIKQKWIKILRSKKYKQLTTGYNRNDYKFCVISVLHDIMKDILGLKWIKQNNGLYKLVLIDGTDLNNLKDPNFHFKYYGITHKNFCKIVYLNDSKELTFKQLANYIERFL